MNAIQMMQTLSAKTAEAEAERDTLRAEVERLRAALQQCKDIAEAIERPDDDAVPPKYRGLDAKNIYLTADKALAPAKVTK